ncbi:hypothetical protein CBR_g23471 [Chara braunii]|uniref:Uncharacterized protein n=1 Tax=Chara braunii TaxID=69332 RepID=A0A388L4A8_CHABU|nr:hypothetical protein CBR_g23471 [Chara braunii]|eukprot:GBG77145.1 hypothetical protein CBR_g23471 [Chara braunii]
MSGSITAPARGDITVPDGMDYPGDCPLASCFDEGPKRPSSSSQRLEMRQHHASDSINHWVKARPRLKKQVYGRYVGDPLSARWHVNNRYDAPLSKKGFASEQQRHRRKTKKSAAAAVAAGEGGGGGGGGGGRRGVQEVLRGSSPLLPLPNNVPFPSSCAESAAVSIAIEALPRLHQPCMGMENMQESENSSAQEPPGPLPRASADVNVADRALVDAADLHSHLYFEHEHERENDLDPRLYLEHEHGKRRRSSCRRKKLETTTGSDLGRRIRVASSSSAPRQEIQRAAVKNKQVDRTEQRMFAEFELFPESSSYLKQPTSSIQGHRAHHQLIPSDGHHVFAPELMPHDERSGMHANFSPTGEPKACMSPLRARARHGDSQRRQHDLVGIARRPATASSSQSKVGGLSLGLTGRSDSTAGRRPARSHTASSSCGGTRDSSYCHRSSGTSATRAAVPMASGSPGLGMVPPLVGPRGELSRHHEVPFRTHRSTPSSAGRGSASPSPLTPRIQGGGGGGGSARIRLLQVLHGETDLEKDEAYMKIDGEKKKLAVFTSTTCTDLSMIGGYMSKGNVSDSLMFDATLIDPRRKALDSRNHCSGLPSADIERLSTSKLAEAKGAGTPLNGAAAFESLGPQVGLKARLSTSKLAEGEGVGMHLNGAAAFKAMGPQVGPKAPEGTGMADGEHGLGVVDRSHVVILRRQGPQGQREQPHHKASGRRLAKLRFLAGGPGNFTSSSKYLSSSFERQSSAPKVCPWFRNEERWWVRLARAGDPGCQCQTGQQVLVGSRAKTGNPKIKVSNARSDEGGPPLPPSLLPPSPSPPPPPPQEVPLALKRVSHSFEATKQSQRKSWPTRWGEGHVARLVQQCEEKREKWWIRLTAQRAQSRSEDLSVDNDDRSVKHVGLKRSSSTRGTTPNRLVDDRLGEGHRKKSEGVAPCVSQSLLTPAIVYGSHRRGRGGGSRTGRGTAFPVDGKSEKCAPRKPPLSSSSDHCSTNTTTEAETTTISGASTEALNNKEGDEGQGMRQRAAGERRPDNAGLRSTGLLLLDDGDGTVEGAAVIREQAKKGDGQMSDSANTVGCMEVEEVQNGECRKTMGHENDCRDDDGDYDDDFDEDDDDDEVDDDCGHHRDNVRQEEQQPETATRDWRRDLLKKKNTGYPRIRSSKGVVKRRKSRLSVIPSNGMLPRSKAGRANRHNPSRWQKTRSTAFKLSGTEEMKVDLSLRHGSRLPSVILTKKGLKAKRALVSRSIAAADAIELRAEFPATRKDACCVKKRGKSGRLLRSPVERATLIKAVLPVARPRGKFGSTRMEQCTRLSSSRGKVDKRRHYRRRRFNRRVRAKGHRRRRGNKHPCLTTPSASTAPPPRCRTTPPAVEALGSATAAGMTASEMDTAAVSLTSPSKRDLPQLPKVKKPSAPLKGGLMDECPDHDSEQGGRTPYQSALTESAGKLKTSWWATLADMGEQKAGSISGKTAGNKARSDGDTGLSWDLHSLPRTAKQQQQQQQHKQDNISRSAFDSPQYVL